MKLQGRDFWKNTLKGLMCGALSLCVLLGTIGHPATYAEETAPGKYAAFEEELSYPTLPEGELARHRALIPKRSVSLYASYADDYEWAVYYALTDAQRKEVDAAVDAIAAQVDSSWSDVNKALFVNDYFALHYQYDLTYSKYSAYDLLVTKTAVCQGYANAYYLVMKKLGIDARIVGSDEINHAWNLIKIGGKWYHVDVTWNDPTPDRAGRCNHNNFLLSEEKLKESHTATRNDWQFMYESGSPTAIGAATDKTYDNAFWTSVSTQLDFVGDTYYCAGDSGIEKRTLSGSPTTLYAIADDLWKALDGGYWPGIFSGCAVYGGRVYFNTPSELRSCKLDGSDVQTHYTLPESEFSKGRFYWCYRDGTVLYLPVLTSPNDSKGSKKIYDLTTGAVTEVSSLTVWSGGKDVKDNKKTDADETAYYKTTVFEHAAMCSGGKWSAVVTDTGVDSAEKLLALYDENGKLTADGKKVVADAKKIASAKVKDGTVTVTAGKTAGKVNVWIVETKNKRIVSDASIGVEPQMRQVSVLTAASSAVFAESGDVDGGALKAGSKTVTKLTLSHKAGAAQEETTLVLVGKKTAFDALNGFTLECSAPDVVTASLSGSKLLLVPIKSGKATVTVTNLQSGKKTKLSVTVVEA